MSELKTVFVTGASGYIGKHIVLQLLNAGYAVKGSVRSNAKADEVRAAIKAHTTDDKILDKLELVELNLMSDEGWDTALSGADVLFHTASPFPLASPKNEDDLIKPAVDGTLRALKAAKAIGISRVVLTSSSVAIMGAQLPSDRTAYTESDWSDIERPNVAAYEKSKVLAERAAWAFVEENPEIALTTINPVLVLGPALDEHFGASLSIVQRVLSGKDPAMPKLQFPIVHVEDIAKMHVAAMEKPASIGQRFIGSSDTMWFMDIAKALKAKLPNYKISLRLAPTWLMRIIGIWDKAVRGIIPDLGKEIRIDNTAAREVLGIDFVSANDTVIASGVFLDENDYV